MRTKRLAFDQVRDVRGLRVIVEDVAQCYQMLSAIHQEWTAADSDFDDYIARPKANGYQSLHTVVTDAQGHTLEVQIRTRRMHESAELGLAAHWRYKESGKPDGGKGSAIDGGDAQRIAWLRQLLAWRDEVKPAAPPAATLTVTSAADERIYVLTPQARVVELPAGGTPVDFAFHIHSEVGYAVAVREWMASSFR